MESIDLAHPTDTLAASPLGRPDGAALEGLRRLEELVSQLPPDADAPALVPLRHVEMLPVFNMREDMNERLISDLVKVLDNGGTLPPVTVLHAGAKAFVVDGHHRLEALRIHARRNGHAEDGLVPVSLFRGTPSEAVYASIMANSRHGVRLTASERTDAAWKLVLIGEKTRSEIREATGVARSWITKMRQVKRQLGEDAADYRSWHRALREANGRTQHELTEDEYEERKRMKAERIADQITEAIGKHSNDPELMAMVMEVVMGRRVGEFIRHLRDLQEDACEADEFEF